VRAASRSFYPRAHWAFGRRQQARLWQSSLAGTDMTVVGGAVVIDAGGYDNVLVEVSATNIARPLSRAHARAGSDVATLAAVARSNRRRESAFL
jgi:hypothetical protein